ncbi:MAG: hypothetical protein WC919_00260 [Candidatus Paceibacterota bacterium]
MMEHSPEVRAAVDQYLVANGAPAPAPKPELKWEIKMPFEELVSIHLNAAGYPNTWFVQNFKKLSAANQERVNAKLVEIGHQPYGVKASKKSNAPRGQQASREPKVLGDEEKQAEATLVHTLDEIRLDRDALNQFTVELGVAEDSIREQLAKLRGVPYDGPLYDPYQTLYKPVRKHSQHNKAEIEASTKCACFFCRAVFDPKAIIVYSEGDTAICPNCGIDAVIGDKTGFDLSEEFLVAMFRRWFSIPIRLRAIRPLGTPKPAPRPAPQLPSSTELPLLEPMKEQEFVVPPHLEEAVPVGIGAALLGRLVDDDDDEEEEPRRVIPMTKPNPPPAEEDEDDDEDDDDDWDDEDEDDYDEDDDDDEEFDN